MGFTDFINTRAAPLGFVGMPFESTFNDRHDNTPYDFWVHDLNHIFRMSNFNKRAFDSLGLTQAALRSIPGQPKDAEARLVIMEQEWSEYKKWDSWVKTHITPLVHVPPVRDIDKTNPQWKKDRNIARLMRLIVFEVFHESAVPPTEEYFAKDLSREAGQLSTFERVHQSCDDPSKRENDHTTSIEHILADLEKIRTIDGNLKSGSRVTDYTHQHRFIEYIQDRAVVTLGNVYNKMCYGFYDEAANPQNYVVDREFRSATFLAEAAHLLFQKLGIPDLAKLDKGDILKQVRSKEGSEELFNVFPTAKGVTGCLEQ